MRIPVVESSQQKIIHIEKLMITKALPIPVVTPFFYISGHQALSLPFILFDLAVALSRRSRTSRIMTIETTFRSFCRNAEAFFSAKEAEERPYVLFLKPGIGIIKTICKKI